MFLLIYILTAFVKRSLQIDLVDSLAMVKKVKVSQLKHTNPSFSTLLAHALAMAPAAIAVGGVTTPAGRGSAAASDSESDDDAAAVEAEAAKLAAVGREIAEDIPPERRGSSGHSRATRF